MVEKFVEVVIGTSDRSRPIRIARSQRLVEACSLPDLPLVTGGPKSLICATTALHSLPTGVCMGRSCGMVETFSERQADGRGAAMPSDWD